MSARSYLVKLFAGMLIGAALAPVLPAAGARLPLVRFRVVDSSMLPAYQPGDRVLVWRLAYARRAPRAGDVVVLRDPEGAVPFLLKRVAAPADGSRGSGVYVLGDNPSASRDSRAFGVVARGGVIGRVVLKY